MEYIDINGFSMPILGLGTFSLKGERLTEIVLNAVKYGYELFDTAFRYGNEEMLGYGLRSIETEHHLVLQSKMSGLQYHGKPGWLHRGKVAPQKALMETSSKLGVGVLDSYLLHSPFKNFHKAYCKLLKLKEEGLVNVLGVSGFDEKQLMGIRDYCGVFPEVNMIEIHPFHSSKRMVEFCKSNNIQVEARSPFAHGDILDEIQNECILQQIAFDYQKSIPQVILRWIVQQDVIAIPRTNNLEHLKENIQIFDFTLGPKQMEEIDSLNRDQSYGVVSKKGVSGKNTIV